MKSINESTYVVTVDEQGVRCRRPNGMEERIEWHDLCNIIIETNDSGPMGTDLFWILMGTGKGSGCIIPGGASGEAELLEALQRLPGFDNRAVIEAMGSVENASFLCWSGHVEAL